MDAPHLFQISVPVQPGNSGGALSDLSGNVIGIVTSRIGDKAAFESSGAIPQNVNYAVKSSYLLALIESEPDAYKNLVKPIKHTDFSTAAQSVEKATVLIFVYE